MTVVNDIVENTVNESHTETKNKLFLNQVLDKAFIKASDAQDSMVVNNVKNSIDYHRLTNHPLKYDQSLNAKSPNE